MTELSVETCNMWCYFLKYRYVCYHPDLLAIWNWLFIFKRKNVLMIPLFVTSWVQILLQLRFFLGPTLVLHYFTYMYIYGAAISPSFIYHYMYLSHIHCRILQEAGGRRRKSCKNSVKWPGSPWVLVAQWIEHSPGVRKVMSSNPIGTRIFSRSDANVTLFHIYLPSCNFTIIQIPLLFSKWSQERINQNARTIRCVISISYSNSFKNTSLLFFTLGKVVWMEKSVFCK